MKKKTRNVYWELVTKGEISIKEYTLLVRPGFGSEVDKEQHDEECDGECSCCAPVHKL